ncbi:hypothetical protein B0T21DRAFT_422503, partial [Apiosordaria backusii]
MTSPDNVQEKTHPEPSAPQSGPGPEIKNTFRSSVFRNPFSFKTMKIGSTPGKLPAFIMITTLLCLVTLGAASPLITPEEHHPAELPHIAPSHSANHPVIPQPHHESEEGEHRQPEQPTYHPSVPQPHREPKVEAEHNPQYHLQEQQHPSEHHEPEIQIRSPVPESPAPLPAGAYTPSTPCPPSLEGQWNCMLTSWQRCGSGIWSAVMPTAKGTQCAPGGLAPELKAVAVDYRDPQPTQPQPQPQGGGDNSWGQGLPSRYNSGGRVGVSMGLAGVAFAVVVVVGGL